MSTPVIIPAKNEAESIGRTLDSLAHQKQEVMPYVIVNDSTDRTADIARETGATVLESEAGKMRAIQEGLRHLGSSAPKPLLILDADTRPLSRRWSRKMTAELENLPAEEPAIIWGPYVFKGEISPILGAVATVAKMRVSWADRHDQDPRTIRGGNMGLKLQTADLLEAMLELDNYWPRQDVAVYDKAMEHGANMRVPFHPDAWAITSGYRITETIKNILKDRRHPSKIADTTYSNEAPSNSKPYNSVHSKRKNKNPGLT